MPARRLRSMLYLLGVLATITVSACGGSSVTGTYHDPSGQITLDLQSGGKAHINIMGEQHDLTYKVEGNKIALHDPADAEGEDVEITVNSDGTLAMAMWTLSKK